MPQDDPQKDPVERLEIMMDVVEDWLLVRGHDQECHRHEVVRALRTVVVSTKFTKLMSSAYGPLFLYNGSFVSIVVGIVQRHVINR